MKVHAMRNDPARLVQDLADVQHLLRLPETDRSEVRGYFEKAGEQSPSAWAGPEAGQPDSAVPAGRARIAAAMSRARSATSSLMASTPAVAPSL